MCEKDEIKKEEPIWFVEAFGAFTNETVQKGLDEKTKRANDVTHIPGIKNPVWEVPDYDFIKDLRRSRDQLPFDFPLKFNSYYKLGDVVRLFKLQDADVRKKSRKRMVNTKKAHIPRSKYTQPQRKGGL